MISFFQCEINGGIRIAPNVGATKNGAKVDDFLRLGMTLGKNFKRDVHVPELFA